MTQWYRIDTVEPPKDETPILLAHINKAGNLLWAVMAIWRSYSPGYMHLASYSGWEPQLPFMKDPVQSLGREEYHVGIIGTTISPPTHWARLLD